MPWRISASDTSRCRRRRSGCGGHSSPSRRVRDPTHGSVCSPLHDASSHRAPGSVGDLDGHRCLFRRAPRRAAGHGHHRRQTDPATEGAAMTIRVALWTTGNIAKFAGRAIVDHPDLELVGAYSWSKEKAGTDVGTLIGIDPIGVRSTHDMDELLPTRPDV